jgi:hypothetical protein
MFEKFDGPEPSIDSPVHQSLVELGIRMDQGQASSDSNIPSGYTYLGQFIAHEITFDPVKEPTEIEELGLLDKDRTPLLDLDSLYGLGPKPECNPELYQADGVRLKVDETQRDKTYTLKFWDDLPRDKNGEYPLRALIADPRNDDNLAVAQTHVAFIKFHNQVVDQLKSHLAGGELFERAREEVIRHYQWIVLHDYLPSIVEERTLADVRDGRKFFTVKASEDLYMPVEFSAAAFRFGHSMVRSIYEWNFFFKQKVFGPAAIQDLFSRTGFSGNLGGDKNLNSRWVIDWRRFYDFTPILTVPDSLLINKAKKIDTTFDFQLAGIPGYPHETDNKNLLSITIRNLLRGYFLRLPTGEAVAQEILAELPHLELMTEAEIVEGPYQAELQKVREAQGGTPLWYYILKEAEVKGKGNRLGPVGSRIVAETLVGIIENSHFYDPGWRPRFGSRAPDHFGMIDMLKVAGGDKGVNPIGD